MVAEAGTEAEGRRCSVGTHPPVHGPLVSQKIIVSYLSDIGINNDKSGVCISILCCEKHDLRWPAQNGGGSA